MRPNGIVVGMLCAALIGGSAGNARAQSAAGPFSELKERVKPVTVYVTDDSGRKVKGTLVDLTATSLTLLKGHDRETFDAGKVVQLTVPRRNTGKGALAGLGIGAAIGLVGVLATCGDCGDEALPFALAGAIVYGGMGAGIGALAGAATVHEDVIYRAPRPQGAGRATLSPLVSKHGAGAALSLRF